MQVDVRKNKQKKVEIVGFVTFAFKTEINSTSVRKQKLV